LRGLTLVDVAALYVRVCLLGLFVFASCGEVTSSPTDAAGGAGGSSSNDAAAGGSAGSSPSAGANGADAGGRGGSSSNAGAAGGSNAGAGGTSTGCTPATVALTAGEQRCNCGGTCGDCPTADGPTCGGTGLGHRNWFGCTVNGAPYFGCAWGSDPRNDGGMALGYCCMNNCSDSLCQP